MFRWLFQCLFASIIILSFNNLATAQMVFEYWEGEIEEKNCYYLEQEVECISVCHLDGHSLIVFFWDNIQGEWALVDHTWLWGQDNAISIINGKTYFSFARNYYPHRYYY